MYKISNWVFQWKMSFSPHPSKQTQEIILSRKTKKTSHPSLRFNNSIVLQTPYQKQRGMFLDARLIYYSIIIIIIIILITIIALLIITTKISKTIELLQKLQNILSRPLLMTIYKAFVRPHLEYGDITYDETCNKNSIRNLEIFKRKLLPRIRLGIPPTLMLVQKTSFILKMLKGSKLVFIFNLIPTKSLDYNTKNTDKITLFHTKHNFSKFIFFHPL